MSDPIPTSASRTQIKTPVKPTNSVNIWLYIMGFVTGIFATLTITILIGWIVNTAFPHSHWLNKGFYGYALGCNG